MSRRGLWTFLGAGLLLLFLITVGLNVFGKKHVLELRAGSVLPAPWVDSQPADTPFNTSSVTSQSSSENPCGDVLHKLLVGRWHQNEMTPTEVETMKRFHRRVRQEEHHIPNGGQRADKKCGNLNVGTTGKLFWFRALCDPDGEVPCCFNNHCVYKSVEECACPNCYDMRTPILAEYATWRPADPACEEPKSMSVEEICGLLGKSTIRFIGDSLVRHVYIALLLAIKGDDETGAFRKDIPRDLRNRCAGIYMFTEKACRVWVAGRTTACGGAVTLMFDSFVNSNDFRKIRQAISELARNQHARSFVFLGVGFHDKMDTSKITEGLLRPLLSGMKDKNFRWPRLLWATIHKFGIMRTPDGYNGERASKFNGAVKDFLAPWGVPVFDTFNMTDNVMSFDGPHYGFGINRMKVRILLQYFRQLKSRGLW